MFFYNQGLFRYIPKDKQPVLAKTIYDLALDYEGQVAWVQADNEIMGVSSDVSDINNTASNIFTSTQDMFDTFECAGWKTTWNGQILILQK